MPFIERLIEFLTGAWDLLAPFEVLHPFHAGVVLRLGKFNREIGPGLNWKWPLLETTIVATVCLTTMRLPPQSLTTKDDVQVVVSSIVKYRIVNVQPFLLDIWDQTDVLADVIAGATQQVVNGAEFKQLVAEDAEKKVATAVRRQVNRFGFEIDSVTFTDFGRVRSLRLLQQGVTQNISN